MNKEQMEWAVRDTLEYYGEDPRGRRSVEEGSQGNCLYDGEDGKRCAIARLANKTTFDMLAQSHEYQGIDAILAKPSLNLFAVIDGEECVMNDNPEFWGNLQSLHDTYNSWWDIQTLEEQIEYGISRLYPALTLKGEGKVRDIAELYDLSLENCIPKTKGEYK